MIVAYKRFNWKAMKAMTFSKAVKSYRSITFGELGCEDDISRICIHTEENSQRFMISVPGELRLLNRSCTRIAKTSPSIQASQGFTPVQMVYEGLSVNIDGKGVVVRQGDDIVWMSGMLKLAFQVKYYMFCGRLCVYTGAAVWILDLEAVRWHEGDPCQGSYLEQKQYKFPYFDDVNQNIYWSKWQTGEFNIMRYDVELFGGIDRDEENYNLLSMYVPRGKRVIAVWFNTPQEEDKDDKLLIELYSMSGKLQATHEVETSSNSIKSEGFTILLHVAKHPIIAILKADWIFDFLVVIDDAFMFICSVPIIKHIDQILANERSKNCAELLFRSKREIQKIELRI